MTNLVSACRTHGLRCQKTLSSSKETFCAPGWSRATFTFTVVCPKDGCRRFFSAFYVVPFFLLSHHMLSDWSHNAKSIGLLVPARRTHAIGDFWLVEWWWTHWCMTFTPDLASDCVRHESWKWQLWWWWQRRPKVERKKEVESKTGTLCQRRCHRKNFIFKFKADTIDILKRLSQPLLRESKTTWVELRKVSCCALSTKSWQKHFGHRCPVQLPCHA